MTRVVALRSLAMDDEARRSNDLRERTERAPPLLEFALRHRENLDALKPKVSQPLPYRADIEIALGRVVGQYGQEVPVAVRARISAGAASEQPYLHRMQHLDDPRDHLRED